ncbi:MAG: TolC family protein [Armatimonadetes bacterium]|nr:TolC family protein [Armatimonadota bacterium]
MRMCSCIAIGAGGRTLLSGAVGLALISAQASVVADNGVRTAELSPAAESGRAAVALPSQDGGGVQRLDLSAAVERARAGHPMLSAAAAMVDSAEAAGRSVTAPYRPMLSLNTYLSDGTGAPIFASTVAPINFMSLPGGASAMQNAMLMWRIYSGGRDRTAGRLAGVQVAAAESLFGTTELDVGLRVRLAFAEAQRREEDLAAERAGLEAARELERVTRERFEAGKVPEAFLFRAQADRARSQRRVAMARAEFQAAVARLKEAVGIPQEEPLTLGEWDEAMEAPRTLDEARRRSLRDRPELAMLDKRREAYSLRGRLADQSGLPEVSLMGMSDLMSTERFGNMDKYKVGLVVSFPLFDGGMRRADADQNRAMSRRTEADLDTMRLRIQAEVAASWAAWSAAPSVLEAAESEVRSSDEAYRIAKLRYESGKAIQVEVSEALADFVTALVGRAQALEYQRRAWAKLMRAVGA